LDPLNLPKGRLNIFIMNIIYYYSPSLEGLREVKRNHK